MTGAALDPQRVGEIRRVLTQSIPGSRLGSTISGNEISWWRAPGRVNLIGDHTDYAGGLALPMAIDCDCLVGITISGHQDQQTCVRARSLNLDEKNYVEVDWNFVAAAQESPWGRFLAAAMAVVADGGKSGVEFERDIELVLNSTVPSGSGLSSSSALMVALVGALSQWGGRPLRGTELARKAHAAEVRATGVPSGLMDQLASVYGKTDHALLIDFESITVSPIALPKELAVVVVNSGVPRALVSSEYAQRRGEVEYARKKLGLDSLRHATLKQVSDNPRARHVVSENNRVLEFVEALRTESWSEMGLLMNASHASLRDDFGVSTPALDELTTALRDAGAVGARLTGAGFGGCVVALVPQSEVTETIAAALTSYRTQVSSEIGDAANALVVHATAGAGPVAENQPSIDE